MWTTYALVALSILSVAAAWFCWYLYKDAIRREIATSEVLCGVLLEPLLHIEFQNVAYEKIRSRFPPGEDYPSEFEVALLQQELMVVLGNSALTFVNANGCGATLRRILTGPMVVGRNPDELWRYAKP
jgi:hypothetical protein